MHLKLIDDKYEERLLQKCFVRYLGPAVLALIFGQIAPLVDALCVSRSLGEEALSMMSVISPIYYLYNVIAVLFGIGTGVFIAKEAGEGINKASGRCFTKSFIRMSFISVILSATLLVFREPVMIFLRSTPENIAYVREYMTVFVVGSIFYVWNFAGSFILTDDNDPDLAMAGSAVASIINMIIDVVGLFVLGQGVWVAAFGTVFGMFCSCLVYALHFKKKEVQTHFDFSAPEDGDPSFMDIAKPGISQGIMYAMIGLKIIIGNYILVFSGGTGGLGAAAVIEDLELVFYVLIAGTSESVMPLAAAYCGEKNQCGMRMVRRSAVIFGYLSIFPFFVLLMVFPDIFIRPFSVDDMYMIENLPIAIRITMVGFLFELFVETQQNYFSATDKEKASIVCGILQSVVQIGALLILPVFTPRNAPWIASLIGAMAASFYVIVFCQGLEGMFRAFRGDTIYMSGQMAQWNESARFIKTILEGTGEILSEKERMVLEMQMIEPFAQSIPKDGKALTSISILDRKSEGKTAILRYDIRKGMWEEKDTSDISDFCMIKRRMITL